jgi:hypothetical protein
MSRLPDTFAVFILTHGRPDNVITYQTLRKCGYTGKLYFIVDDEDKSVEQYKRNFGADRVIVFDKKAEANRCDEGNNFDERRTILMARNACFGIAERLGVTHFMQLDDDYQDFRHKAVETRNGLYLVKNLDRLIANLLDFYRNVNFTSLAIAQGGDFIGGISAQAGDYRFPRRKCMNTFICSVHRPFRFVGAMNEDVNTFTSLGSRGALFMTIPVAAIQQKQTQAQPGGITDMYLRFGTYCKALTTVMMMPSSVKVSMLNTSNPRIHDTINWKCTVPQIVPERYRKADQ